MIEYLTYLEDSPGFLLTSIEIFSNRIKYRSKNREEIQIDEDKFMEIFSGCTYCRRYNKIDGLLPNYNIGIDIQRKIIRIVLLHQILDTKGPSNRIHGNHSSPHSSEIKEAYG